MSFYYCRSNIFTVSLSDNSLATILVLDTNIPPELRTVPQRDHEAVHRYVVLTKWWTSPNYHDSEVVDALSDESQLFSAVQEVFGLPGESVAGKRWEDMGFVEKIRAAKEMVGHLDGDREVASALQEKIDGAVCEERLRLMRVLKGGSGCDG